MLRNVKITASAISGLLRESQQGGGEVKLPPPPLPRLRLICNYLEKLGKLGSRKSTL